MELIFATHNENKVKEIEPLLPLSIKIKSLSAFNYHKEIPETADTLEGNALIKASTIAKKFNVNCASDDTGLEVAALNGRPGVYSARYAGKEKNSESNIEKLLSEMEGKDKREAQFRTVVVLILKGKEHYFEGIVKGHITTEKKGDSGFGYDPIFMPDGKDKTFAQMDMAEKNKISHRALAIQQLVDFLSNLS